MKYTYRSQTCAPTLLKLPTNETIFYVTWKKINLYKRNCLFVGKKNINIYQIASMIWKFWSSFCAYKKKKKILQSLKYACRNDNYIDQTCNEFFKRKQYYSIESMIMILLYLSWSFMYISTLSFKFWIDTSQIKEILLAFYLEPTPIIWFQNRML